MPAKKRETIKPNPGDKRFIRRDSQGEFSDDQVDVGRSLSQDDQKRAQHVVPEGQGDRGDRKKGSR